MRFRDKYFNDKDSLRDKLCRMMIMDSAIGLLIDAILRSIMFETTVNLVIVPIVASVIIGLTFLLSAKLKFGRNLYFIILFVSAEFMIPMSFLLSGGIASGNPMWMVLGITMTFILLDGWRFWVMLVCALATDCTLFIIAAYRPDAVLKMDYVDARVDSLISLIIVGSIIGLLLRYMNYLYTRERELNERQKAEIRDMARSKDQFFANMSHEIRTPINTIIGLNEMTLREDVSEEVAENAANIQRAGKLLLTVVNDILDISKLESGKMDIVTAPYETAALFGDLLNMIWVRAQQKKLDLRIDVPEDLPSMLIGDEVRIKQVLTNILSNAVKYTEKGSVIMTVRGEPAGDGVLRLKIAVEDTGIGIRKENIDQLFDVFGRFDKHKNKNIEGTGLGLAIAKQLVDMMGGQITVDSIYQKGSCFTVIIDQPIADPTPLGSYNAVMANVRKENNPYKQSFEAPQAKVLIVDDNDMNLLVARKLLRETRVQIDTASSGEECLEKTGKELYHVILMDYMMPVMNGEETLKRLRQRTDGFCQNTPVIALTANVMTNAAAWYQARGFSGYLAKPINGSLLEAALRQFIPAELIENAADDNGEYFGENEASSIIFHQRKRKIGVTVDGICDIPEEWQKKLDIRMIHYYVTTDEGRFIDTKEIDTGELLGYIGGGGRAFSSAAEVDEYERFFADQLMEAEQIIHISTASGTGDGHKNAVQAAKGFDNVTVIDSGQISSGIGILAMHAAQSAQDGMSREEIVKSTLAMRERISTSFILPSAECMYRNGRVSRLVMNLSRLFRIRPVLCMRHDRIELQGFILGRMDAAAKSYVRSTLRFSSRIDGRMMFVTHAGLTVKQLELIKSDVQGKKQIEHLRTQRASSAIASNCGKGCFGLIYIRK